MAAAEAYLASFRPVQPFDSSSLRTTEFTQALGAIPAANAAILAGAMKLGLEQGSENQRFNQELAFNKDKFNAEKQFARRRMAIQLAQGFLGGGGFGGNSAQAMVPISEGLDPYQTEEQRIQREKLLNEERLRRTRRSSGVAGTIIEGIG